MGPTFFRRARGGESVTSYLHCRDANWMKKPRPKKDGRRFFIHSSRLIVQTQQLYYLVIASISGASRLTRAAFRSLHLARTKATKSHGNSRKHPATCM